MHVTIVRAPFALVLAATLAASFIGAAAPARAQDDAGGPPAGAPPAVARLSVVDGQVALKHGDSADQASASENAPVVAGDYITTGNDGHAEVQLDSANLIRAGADTQVRFTQLDGANDVTQLAQGSLELRVFATGQDNVRVQTPSVDVEPSQAGAYLITVTSDGNTQVTARSGSVAVVTPQGTQEVDPGRTMVVTGAANDPQYQYIDEVAQSDIEAWGDQRDQMLAAGESAQSQYVPSDMTGSADLNQYGNWVNIPGYGDAWVPNDVAPGWTPYSDGSWVSLNYYGPTWVGAEPWGWAPYHYGRWFFAPAVGWAWTPGPRSARAVWSPALVAFAGFSGGVRVGVGFGNAGWVPLAPGESNHPWWGRGASFSAGASLTSYRNYSHGFVSRAQPISSSSFAANAINRGATGVARPGYSSTSAGWQRFGGTTQQRYPSYARPYSASEQQQRRYGAYQQQRQYGAYQQQRQYGAYQQQRQYGAYQQQRRYAQPQQRQYQSYGAPRQSYQAQRQYGSPQQRTQYYRPQQSSRSAPSHGSYGGNHPRGPGRP